MRRWADSQAVNRRVGVAKPQGDICMQASERARLIKHLSDRGTAELENFFISTGLGQAFARPKEGWGRMKRVNEALLEAEREGRLDEVLRAAAIHFLGATSTGEPPKTPNRIRLDLNELMDEIDEWDTWHHFDVAEEWQRRLNDALRHLRAHVGQDAPDDFSLRPNDYSSTGKTINDQAFKRLRRAVKTAISIVPAAPDNQMSAPSEPALHPRIERVALQLFKDGHHAPAVLEAYKAVNNRVRSRLPDDGKSLMGKAFSPQNPRIKLNPGATRSHQDEQEGFMHIFMGAMQGIRNPKAHDEHVELEHERTLEYLSLASLLMRRLDDAETLSSSKGPST
jgi:uncharacterized protein (TIGR02391 family)